jgi:hypothetical protein
VRRRPADVYAAIRNRPNASFAKFKTNVYNVSPTDSNHPSNSVFNTSGSVLAGTASRSGGSGKDKNVSFNFNSPNDIEPGSGSVVLESAAGESPALGRRVNPNP